MKTWILSITKWMIVSAFAGFVFYTVCPKYDFQWAVNSQIIRRCNRITGSVEIINATTGKPRRPLSDFFRGK